MIDVSVILVSYNTCKLTCDAIAAVYSKTDDVKVELILVDNNSKDDTVGEVSARFPDVLLIENKTNIGFGRANNQGMKMAKGKYLFLLNTDTVLINNAIYLLYTFMETEENANVNICGGQLFNLDGSLGFSYGNFHNYRLFVKGSFWKYFYANSFFKDQVRMLPKHNQIHPFEVEFVSGADFFVRKKVIDQVGGFDERFFMYDEDVELSFRIQNMNATSINMIVPSAKIVHIGHGSNTSGTLSRTHQLLTVKSRSMYYKITEGFLASLIYKLTSLKRIYM
jgi:GT2 family glycosyltransferase